MVRDNLAAVERNVRAACQKAGRKREEVTVVAVSKHNPPEKIMEAYTAGCRHFGENRVQELLDKIDRLPTDINWHLIGHLQRNKVKYIIDKVVMIHSVDSLRLAEEISKEASRRGLVMDILIEVNVAGEESKHGTTLAEAPILCKQAAALPGIRVVGLMTIAPLTANAENNRQYFAGLKQLSVDMIGKNIDNTTIDVISMDNLAINKLSMAKLSMGMTGDYMTAIEEGASIVRIGTGIFKD